MSTNSSSPMPSTDPGGFTPRPTSPQSDNPGQAASSPPRPHAVSRDGDAAMIQPTWPKVVNIKNTRADVKWQPDAHLDGVYFDLHWTGQHNPEEAFFRLCAHVQLPNANADDDDDDDDDEDDNVTRLYLLIPPERIQTLTALVDGSAEEEPDTGRVAESKSISKSSRPLTLSFVMLQPPVLVAPKDLDPLTAVSHTTTAKTPMIQSLFALAAQLSFVVHVNVSYARCSSASLQHICTAVSKSPGLRSIERFAISKVSTLYEGKGGQILEKVLPGVDGDGDDDDDDGVDVSLPAYTCQQTDRSPPYPAPGHKRRRASAEVSDSHPSPSPLTATQKRPCDRSTPEAMVSARPLSAADSIAASMNGWFSARKRELENIITQSEARIEARLEERLTDLEQRLTASMDQRLEQLQDEWRQKELTAENARADLAIGVREELAEDFEAAMQQFMDEFTSLPLTAHLTFQGHPDW